MQLETRAVRAGRMAAEDDSPRSGREGGQARGTAQASWETGAAHVPGIDLSTTYSFRTADAVAASMDALLEGAPTAANPVYARLHNPTVRGFEEALASLEDAADAVAFASGMAAITATIMAATSGEDGSRRPHVVAVRPVYGGTDHLLSSGLLGTEVSWVDQDAVADAVRAETGLVMIETPANPTLALVDIRAVVEQATAAGSRWGRRIPVAVDSTFATPVLQNPVPLGADFAVHSATKFLGGHGDVMGGVVATSEEWAVRLRQLRMMTGALLHPLAGYLLHRGLQTLPVRVRAQQTSAELLARRLATHPEVRQVLFPGLRDDRRERRLLAMQQRGPGAVLSFRVAGGADGARRVVEGLDLITRAVSLGSVDSLIEAPALLTHRIVDPADRESSGVPDDLLRLSVGLESVEDLWDDLERALYLRRRSVV